MSISATSMQIHIRPAPGTWTVRAGGALVAHSTRALELIEGSRAAVLYFPREDVAMDLMDRSDSASACPHKGAASYFSVVTPAGRTPDAAWSYETPKQSVGAIAGYLAFYPDKVSVQAG